MIVKFLRKSESFTGVRYNTNKFEQDKGELMLVSGFGALQGLEDLRPSDYINYLEAMSAGSKRIRYPQLHVVISAKGQSHSAEELTVIARDWMEGMGYGEQPFIVVFHKDTDNAHVHIVSTRVDRNGRKINDSFERLRAYEVLNRVMAEEPALRFQQDLDEALAFRFSTRAQFAMLMEARGYQLELKAGLYRLFKFGKLLGEVDVGLLDSRIAAYQKDSGRVSQLRAIVERYRKSYSGVVFPVFRPLPGGLAGPTFTYASPLSELLREKFGVQVLYHASPGKPPYGYSVLDHAGKMVLKGKELMDLQEFLRPAMEVSVAPVVAGEDLVPVAEGLVLTAAVAREDCAADASVPGSNADGVERGWDDEVEAGHAAEAGAEAFKWDHSPPSALSAFELDIADDVDDEQVLGPTRRRKRKARTNTR